MMPFQGVTGHFGIPPQRAALGYWISCPSGISYHTVSNGTYCPKGSNSIAQRNALGNGSCNNFLALKGLNSRSYQLPPAEESLLLLKLPPEEESPPLKLLPELELDELLEAKLRWRRSSSSRAVSMRRCSCS
jgi:hypothetical protein